MDQTLMALVGERMDIMNMIEDPEVDQQTVLDSLDSVDGAIEVKADGYAIVLRGIEFQRAGLKAKKEYIQNILNQLDKADKNLEDTENAMKDRLMAAMIAIGKDEEGIKTDNFEFKINSTGGVPKLQTTNEVPQEFMKQKITYEKDNKKIREYIKDHDVDWAWLLPTKKNLVIKGV